MYYIYLDWFWPLGTVPFTKFVVIFCKTSYLSISMHLSQKFVNQRQCIFLFWEIHLMSILYHERVSYCLWICVLKNEIKLFLKSLLELILWNTVSYVLCFLLVFYIAQVSAFLLYPPFCYVSYMCLLIISLFFLILSWRLWLSVSLCSRLLWSIPDNVICWVPDVNLRLSRWFTLVCSWFYFFLFISRDQYICRQEVTINPS